MTKANPPTAGSGAPYWADSTTSTSTTTNRNRNRTTNNNTDNENNTFVQDRLGSLFATDATRSASLQALLLRSGGNPLVMNSRTLIPRCSHPTRLTTTSSSSSSSSALLKSNIISLLDEAIRVGETLFDTLNHDLESDLEAVPITSAPSQSSSSPPSN